MKQCVPLFLVAFVIFSGFAIWGVSFFATYYSYQKAKSKTIQLEVDKGNGYSKNSPNDKSLNHDNQIINSLQSLTEYNVIGNFFLQQKILELAKADRWQQVIKQSLKAIETSVNKKSFSIWYHKALAQCILQKISDCEQSAKQASFLSFDSYHEGYLSELFKYIQQIKKQQLSKKNKKNLNKQKKKNNVQSESDSQQENQQVQKIVQKQKTKQVQKQSQIKSQDDQQQKTSYQESNAYYQSYEQDSVEVDSDQLQYL